MQIRGASLVGCAKCPDLCSSRLGITEGEGAFPAILLVIGEAPGEQEDGKGPFRGRSGKKVRSVLGSLGAKVTEVYWSNAVRCRPEGNRTPTKAEIDNCLPWLVNDILSVRPKAILCLGKTASLAVSRIRQEDDGILSGIEVIDTWHPSYIGRKPELLKEWTRDLDRALRTARGETICNTDPKAAPWKYGPPDWASQWLSCDTETDSAEEGWGERLVTAQYSDGRSAMMRTTGIVPNRELVRKLRFHNAVYDAPLLGWDLNDLGSWDDSMLMAYVLRLPVGLKTIGPQATGIPMRPITDFIGTGKHRIPVSQAYHAFPRGMTEYALKDAVVTARLSERLEGMLRAQPRQWRYYQDFEKPMVPVLLEMEREGCLIDPEPLVKLRETMTADLERLKARVESEFDGVNPASGNQVAQWLLRKGVQLTVKTESGAWATDVHVLKAVGQWAEEAGRRDIEGFVGLVQEYRSISGVRSRSVDGLLNARDSHGYVHTHWNQVGADTNRILSRDPNLMNQPNPEKLPRYGIPIRQSFVAPRGFVIVKGDLSQLEFRYIAEYSGEAVLIEAYHHHGADVHRASAEALKIPRAIAKNVNFALIYMADLQRAAVTGGVPESEAAAFIEDMKRQMPRVFAWPQVIRAMLEADGYIENPYGWRMYFPAIFSTDGAESSEAHRQAVNAPMQSSGASFAKRIMIAARTLAHRFGGGLRLHVYDEFVFVIPEGAKEEFCHEFKKLEELAKPEVEIPMEMEISWGPSWGQLTKVEDGWTR